jgi:uncharacterized protein (DUF1499 family)
MTMLLLIVLGCGTPLPLDPLPMEMGPLQACPSTPNCVSSEADANDPEHAVSPLRPRPSQSPAELLAELENELATWPRTTLVARGQGALRYEVRSRVFRFVDDVELRVDDAAGEVDVRSASRVGKSDLGVNRDRVEALRAASVKGI